MVKNFKRQFFFLVSTLFGPKGIENTCSGDSGSPLMMNLNGQFVQVLRLATPLKKLDHFTNTMK